MIDFPWLMTTWIEPIFGIHASLHRGRYVAMRLRIGA